MLLFRSEFDELIVIREKDEKRLYLESTFYRNLSRAFNKLLGTDTIPKEMYKDGHMYPNEQFYLVDRKRRFGFYQNDWATFDINKDYFNKQIPVALWCLADDHDFLGKIMQKLPKMEWKKETKIIDNVSTDVYIIRITDTDGKITIYQNASLANAVNMIQ